MRRYSFRTAVTQGGAGDVVRYVEQDVAPTSALYEKDALYPTEIARVSNLGRMRS